METHNFKLEDSISISSFLKTAELACDANRIHESATLWVILSFVADLIASSLNCGINQIDRTKGINTKVNCSIAGPQHLRFEFIVRSGEPILQKER